MMTRLMLFFLLFISFPAANCQDLRSGPRAEIIQVDSLFQYYGVIFDSSYSPPILIRNIKDRFTPSINDIIATEQIFVHQYQEAGMLSETDARKKFKKYNRQYVGFIDSAGSKNVVLLLFDYSKKRQVKRNIGDSWKDNFLVMFSEDPPFTIKMYKVNLNERKFYQ